VGETMLKAARQARGWTQSRLINELERQARAEGFMPPGRESLRIMVSRWENGHAVPDSTYCALLSKVYRLDGRTLGISAALRAPEVDPSNEELRARLSCASSVDADLVACLQQQTDSIRVLDRRLGAPVLLDQMRAHVATLTRLLSHVVLPTQRGPLAAVLADAAALAGWQALDVGSDAHAWTYYESAKAAAREAECPVLLGHAMGEQAFALIDLQQPALAVQLIEEARRQGGQRLPALLRSWLWAAEAEACAAAGEDAACRRAVDLADQQLPRASAEPGLPYLALDEVHLARWRGHSLARLGDTEAIGDLRSALDRMDHSFTRAEAALRCDLATALLARGEQEEATREVVSATELASRTGSVRQQRRIQRLTIAA
jgi:transcriptional regulator with XRE-family HTH domain